MGIVPSTMMRERVPFAALLLDYRKITPTPTPITSPAYGKIAEPRHRSKRTEGDCENFMVLEGAMMQDMRE